MSYKKYLIEYLLGPLVLFATSLIHGQQIQPCSGSQQCGRQLRPIVETPAGPVDGANGTFTLSETPADGRVRFFDNGIEYPQQQAFNVSGKTVSLSASLAPRRGDVIRVSYMTASTAPGSTGRAAGVSDDHQDMIIRQSLLQAAMRESVPVTDATQEDAAPPLAVVQKAGLPQRALESMSMLSRKTDNHQKTRRRQQETDNAAGFEGLGDSPVPNPYSALLSGTNPRPAPTRRIIPASTARDHQPNTPQALVLLQQRLQAADTAEEQTR